MGWFGNWLTILLWMQNIRRRNMQYRMKNKTTSSLTQKLVGAYVVTPICLEALLQIAFLN